MKISKLQGCACGTRIPEFEKPSTGCEYYKIYCYKDGRSVKSKFGHAAVRKWNSRMKKLKKAA